MNTTVARSGEMIASEVDGEVVMLGVEDGKYYGMDDIGSRIWTLLDKPRKVSELCALLEAQYDVSAAQCAEDVLTFLNELQSRKIIEVVDDASG